MLFLFRRYSSFTSQVYADTIVGHSIAARGYFRVAVVTFVCSVQSIAESGLFYCAAHATHNFHTAEYRPRFRLFATESVPGAAATFCNRGPAGHQHRYELSG